MSSLKNQLKTFNVIRWVGNSYIVLDFDDLDDWFSEAQDRLDFMVTRDMLKYVPVQSGRLAEEIVEANNNSMPGMIYVFPANVQYGHYQWEGDKYIWPNHKRKGASHKVPTGIPLNYPSNPQATRHWDEAAIRDCSDKWVKELQKMFS